MANPGSASSPRCAALMAMGAAIVIAAGIFMIRGDRRFGRAAIQWLRRRGSRQPQASHFLSNSPVAS